MNKDFISGFEKQAGFSDSTVSKAIANRASRVGAVKKPQDIIGGVYNKIKGGLDRKAASKGMHVERSGKVESLWHQGSSGDHTVRLSPTGQQMPTGQVDGKIHSALKRENQMGAVSAAQKMFPKKQ